MSFSRYGQYVLCTQERSSRLLSIERLPNKTAAQVAARLLARFAPLPHAMRRSLTFDNGTEFARHDLLNHTIGLATFFCDTHAPWQKGGIENAIGRMRRPLPRKTDLDTLTSRQLDDLVQLYNDTPRKCLAFKTPIEVFSSFLNRVALQT